ncbi:MAG: ATP-binding protein, partial [Proteobacteria bacterium]
DNKDGKLACFKVTNQGIGISEDEQESIFLPFRQSKQHKIGGTGLGLAYSKGLIELHGGTIEVRSIAQTETSYKTTFTVQLPLQTELSANLPTRETPPSHTNLICQADISEKDIIYERSKSGR